MAELNKLLIETRTRSDRLNTAVRDLLISYENLYREAHNQFISERIASNGNMTGLEEFNHLVNVIHRNRDVVGAFQRGLKSLRPIEGFSFVEENAAEEKKVQEKKQAKTVERKKKRAEQQAELEAAIAQAPTLDELIEGPSETTAKESSAEEVTNNE